MIGSRNKAISGSNIREIADKKTAITRAACTVKLGYNEQLGTG